MIKIPDISETMLATSFFPSAIELPRIITPPNTDIRIPKVLTVRDCDGATRYVREERLIISPTIIIVAPTRIFPCVGICFLVKWLN